MIHEVKIVGLTPLLMHNGQLSDPLNEHAKALKKLSSKRNKSDDDHAEMGRVEWLGGLYYDPDMGPFVPSEMIEAMIKAGAKLSKAGKLAEACVVCVEDRYPLGYKGPRAVSEIIKEARFFDRRTIRVQQSRVVRTRPRFNDWSCQFTLSLTPGRLNPEQVRTALDDAGLYVGLGDYRPKFGRFRVESFAEKKGLSPHAHPPLGS